LSGCARGHFDTRPRIVETLQAANVAFVGRERSGAEAKR